MTLVFGFAMAVGPTAVAVVAEGDTVRWLGPAVAVVASAAAVAALSPGRGVVAL